MNLEVNGTKKILLVEESQGLSLHTDSKNFAVAIGGVSVKGPQGIKGDKGDTGLTGIVEAVYPLIYIANERKITLDVGFDANQVVIGSDARLTNERIPIDASVTNAKINGTLDQSKITNLPNDLSAIQNSLNAKAAINHNHSINQIVDIGTAASKNIPITGNAATSEVVLGTDTRLQNSRIPTGSAGGDLTGTYPNPTLATGSVTSSHILNGTIVDADISSSASISQSKIAGLSTSFNSKQDTSAKNQANGYVGLNSNTKIDSQYLPVQNPTQYANVSSDSAFNIAAVSPYGSITWAVGDKIIKTGGTNPGTYVKFQTTNNNYTDWFLEAASGISQIETALSPPKIGSSVSIGISDIGAAAAVHAHSAADITSGILNIDRIPTGNSLSTVALGSHTHEASAITTGTISIDRLPAGTSHSELAYGDHTHTASNVGALAITNNLSEINSAGNVAQNAARTNLALGEAATKNIGTSSTEVAAGNHTHAISGDITGVWTGTDLALNLKNDATARNNLGLKGAAQLDVGVTSNTVAAGNHTHVINTAHNFIIQGNIVTSESLEIPPFVAVNAFPYIENIQSAGTTKLIKMYAKLGYSTGTVSIQIFKNDSAIPMGSPLTTTHTISTALTPKDADVSIATGDLISLNVTGISPGSAPRNLTVTLVFEHRLNP